MGICWFIEYLFVCIGLPLVIENNIVNIISDLIFILGQNNQNNCIKKLEVNI